MSAAVCPRGAGGLILLLFNRFAHSAGPGMVRHRVEWIGSGMDGREKREEKTFEF